MTMFKNSTILDYYRRIVINNEPSISVYIFIDVPQAETRYYVPMKKRLFCLSAGITLVASITSSILVESFLNSRIPLIGPYVGLHRTFNTGVAFGVNLGMIQPFFIAIALGIVLWLLCTRPHSKVEEIAFGLVVGGAIANIIDRILDGKVTDVFQVMSFPIFNVADSAITIGVLILALCISRSEKQEKSQNL
jgi:signal peptidase II